MEANIYMKFVLVLLISAMIVPLFIMMSLTPPQKVVFLNCFYYQHEELGGTCEIMDQVVKFYMNNREMRLFGSEKLRNSIEYVRIIRSDFDFIPDQFYKSFKNLKRMDVYNTTIEALEKASFEGADNLKYLNLDNNNIKFLADNTFEGLKSLESLSVEDNKIVYLGANLFQSCDKLNSISFKGNDIEMIDESLRKSAKTLDVSDNPCVADESLQKCFDNAKNSVLINEFREKYNIYKVNRQSQFVDNDVEFRGEVGFIEATTPFFKMAYIIGIICYVGYNLWGKLLQGQKKKQSQKSN